MKKVLSLILVSLMLLGMLVGCGGNNAASNGADNGAANDSADNAGNAAGNGADAGEEKQEVRKVMFGMRSNLLPAAYLDEAGKAQSEVSELKREVFRLQQRLDSMNRNR